MFFYHSFLLPLLVVSRNSIREKSPTVRLSNCPFIGQSARPAEIRLVVEEEDQEEEED